MSDAIPSTPSAGSSPTRKPLPVPGPVEDPAPLRSLEGETNGEWSCPHCSAVLEAAARFCEVCGYDPSTGSLPAARAPLPSPLTDPAAAATAPPVTGQLIAVITADADYFATHQIEEVQFPLAIPPRSIGLPDGPVSIGRRSRSRGTNPSIDLAGPPEDPAVSHTHASLVPNDDGSWALVDHGSTNGTFLNESPDPVPANQPLPLAPGDRIYLGAWTKITLEQRP